MMEFEELVDAYHQALYRFAFLLVEDGGLAEDLVQRAFVIWGREDHPSRERRNAGTGLFATLYREHLGSTRRQPPSPGREPGEAGPERSSEQLDPGSGAPDSEDPLELLGGLDETFRAPLALFYLQQHGYREIATILDLPIGTVMSRISRGKEQLRRRMVREPACADMKVVAFQSGVLNHSNG